MSKSYGRTGSISKHRPQHLWPVGRKRKKPKSVHKEQRSDRNSAWSCRTECRWAMPVKASAIKACGACFLRSWYSRCERTSMAPLNETQATRATDSGSSTPSTRDRISAGRQSS